VRLYGVLLSHADTKGVCWPGQDRLAVMTGKSERTVRRALAELETESLIESKQTGRGRTNRYHIKTGQIWPVNETKTGHKRPIQTGQKWPVHSEVDPKKLETTPPTPPDRGGSIQGKVRRKRRRTYELAAAVEAPFVPGLYFDEATDSFTHKERQSST